MSHSLLPSLLRVVACLQDKKPGLWTGSWGLAGGECGWEVRVAPGQPLVLLKRGTGEVLSVYAVTRLPRWQT